MWSVLMVTWQLLYGAVSVREAKRFYPDWTTVSTIFSNMDRSFRIFTREPCMYLQTLEAFGHFGQRAEDIMHWLTMVSYMLFILNRDGSAMEVYRPMADAKRGRKFFKEKFQRALSAAIETTQPTMVQMNTRLENVEGYNINGKVRPNTRGIY